MVQNKQSLKTAMMFIALMAAPFLSAQYASFYGSKKNVTYDSGANLVLDKAILPPKGVTADKKGSTFIIHEPGIYYMSFNVRAKVHAPAKATTLVVTLNGQDVPGSQSTSTTAEISNIISMFNVEVPKANSKITLKNITKAAITILDGSDLEFNVQKIDELPSHTSR